MMRFDVESLAPLKGGRGAAKLGLRPLNPVHWLDRSPGWEARAAAKAAVFDACPEALIALPGSEAAAAELAGLLGAAGPTLRDAALAAFEDWCLLVRRGDVHVFVAGALAFPTDWSLAEKMGLEVRGIHAPVPGFLERLAAGVDHVFAALTPARMLTRANWNIVETDVLRYLPEKPARERFGHVTAANAGETLWLRIERQTLRRLPETGAACFGIGIYREPLRALSAPLVRDLAAAVASLPEAEAARRGTAGYAAALSAYAAARG